MADLTWIPDSLRNLLQRSEAHYRSIGFKRTAHHMKASLESATSRGTISEDFYPRYVQLLKDDVKEFMHSWEIGRRLSEHFIDSMIYSIDRIASMLEDLDSRSKTPTFNGSTSHPEDVEAIEEYIDRNGGIYDPLTLTTDPYEALDLMDPFYDLIYNHVYVPGRDYLVSQLDLAVGHEKMMVLAEEILAVSMVLPMDGETVSDFRHAFQVPGYFTDDEASWVVADDCVVPIEEVARWPLFMYYKVPILTAMLPIHNIRFFYLVQDRIEQQSSYIQNRMR
ncbi:MAG: hypothetical protein MJZ38_01655 [archaeon]|nr:hypothetical protein [archaeon]